MLRKITKAKLDYDSRYCDVLYDELDEEGNVDHLTRESEGKKRKVHDDLINSFKAILIHLIVLCEQFSYTDIEDNPDLLEKFTLTGFVIGGKDEHEGVTLIGQRRLDNNQVLNLVAPFTKFHPDHATYLYIGSLAEGLQVSFKEIDAFVMKTKMAPDNQLSLFEANEANREEKPKRGRKKKVEEESEEVDAEEEEEVPVMKMTASR